jgi:FkbM family methyltransferase
MSPAAVRLIAAITSRYVRNQGLVLDVRDNVFDPQTRSALFWGIYERHEIHFIRSGLKDATAVVELGAGRGISTAHIASLLPAGATLIAVEANQRMHPAIRRNVRRVARPDVSFHLVSAAVSATERAELEFVVERDPLTSHAGPGSGGLAETVRAKSLTQILADYELKTYDLVSDIEGAEAGFILADDQSALDRCRRLVIELHAGRFGGVSFTVETLLSVLRNRWNFQLIERKGAVALLERVPPNS